MVLIHLKKNDASLFLAQCPAAGSTDDAIDALVHLHNERLRIERLCVAVEDLAKYGVFKPYAQHGYQPEDLDKFVAAGDAEEEAGGQEQIVTHEGREYRKVADPTGRRTGLAPLATYAATLEATVAEARDAIAAKQRVAAKHVTTADELRGVVDRLRAAVAIAYPMGIPEYDSVREILDGTEDLGETIHAKEVLDAANTALWWAGKELVRGKLLSDYVGRNDKTTIIAKLARRGMGAPMREPVMDEAAQREMMAFYYRKQEELKRLEDDEDDTSYTSSAWANPRALKSTFQGLSAGGNVAFRPR
ncbi:hypothetical protein H9P43_006191 [Blastocladiella emersonii ATCC 22665]|nr:hypothetical protein H9P43_006191 [Blastocladiella emersonii ATCC 22665]